MSLGTATLVVELDISRMRAGMRSIESMMGGLGGQVNSGLNSGLSSSVSTLGNFNSALATSLRSAAFLGAAFSEIGSKIGSLGDGLNRALGSVNFSNVLDLGTGLESFINLERLQNSFRATALSSGSTAEEIALVNEEVERLAQVTSKSPEQVAELAIELGRAGFSSTQIAASLKGVVYGSEAAGERLSSVGRIVGATLNQFQLLASESTNVSDILTATANNSATDIVTIGEALKFVGTASFNSQQSLEDTAVAIGLLGDAGLRGGNAGRNLASALQSLNEVRGRLAVGQTNKKTDALEMLGLDLSDLQTAEGELKSILDLIPILQKALASVDTQKQPFIMQQLFGTQGQRAISSLLSQTGEDIDDLREKVSQAAGVSKELSEIQLEGLSGSVSLLQGKFSAVSNEIGAAFAPAVKGVIEVVGSLADGFLSLPEPVRHAVVLIGTLGPAALLATQGIAAMGLSVGAVAAPLALAAAGIGTLAALMERSPGAQLADSIASSRKELEEFIASAESTKVKTAELEFGLSAIAENFRNFGAVEGFRQSLAQGFTELSSSFSDSQIKMASYVGFLGGPLTGALSLVAGQMIKNTDATTDYGNAFSFLTAEQRGNQLAMLELDKLLDVTASKYQEGMDLLMNQSMAQEDLAAAAGKLIPIYEQNISALQAQLDLNDGLTESQKILIEDNISSQQFMITKLQEKAGLTKEVYQQEGEDFAQVQQDMVEDVASAQREMLQEIESGYRDRISQAELAANQEMIAIKKAYATGKIDKESYQSSLDALDRDSLRKREAIIKEEIRIVEEAYRQQKISTEDYGKTKLSLTKELQSAIQQQADAEIRAIEKVAEAYREKLQIMDEEMGLQQDLNDLAIAQAEAGGASELEIAKMKLQQLLQIQESERQRLEIQLAQNMASATDQSAQAQINNLLRERLAIQQQVAATQAQTAISQLGESSSPGSSGSTPGTPGASAGVRGGGGISHDDVIASRIKAFKEESELRQSLIDKEISSLELLNEQRNIELETIQQSMDALQQRSDIESSKSELLITSLENQVGLADELLGLLNAGAEADAVRAEIANQLNLPAQASELEILERKHQLQQQIAEEQAVQMEKQHALQDRILLLENEQLIINAEQAIQEAQINELKSQQAVLAAEAAIAIARANDESSEKVRIAEIELDLAKRQLALSQSQVKSAQQAKDAIEQQNKARTEALDLTQAIEVSERENSAAATERASELAIATAEAKSNSEGMADAMGRVADSAGQAADAMGKAADAAGSAANAVKDMSGGSGNQGKGLVASSSSKNTNIYKDGAGEPWAKLGASGSSSTSSNYANVDLADIAKRELELAAKIAEANGNTAQAQAIRDQIASENKKMELKALQDEANYLREQRALYHSERQRFIDQTIAVSKSLQRATGVPTLRNFEQEAATQAQKIFGGSGGIGDLSGGKSMQLLGQALQGFNPQIQQQQMAAQQQMGKAIDSGNKDVSGKLDKINDTIGRAMSRPTEVNISGSEDIGGDVSKTLKALQMAQR